MIIKKNEYNTMDSTIVDYLTEQESNELRTISSIPVLESNGSYIISYDHIRDISEAYDIEDIDVINTINESNGIEGSIISIDESDIILDADIVNRVPNYVISPLSYNSDENLLIEGFFNAFEESGDYDYLDILEENFEDIIINESRKGPKRRHNKKKNAAKRQAARLSRTISVNSPKSTEDDDPVTTAMMSFASQDRARQGTGKATPANITPTTPKAPPKVEKVDNNTVSVEQPPQKETSTQSNTENPSTNTSNEKDTPNRVSTNKTEEPPKSNPSTNKKEEGVKSFYSKNKKTIGGVGAGLALGGLALANRKRIANGISALRNKLNKYKMQRKYYKSGAVGKAIIRIQQMIERLTARLHASK